jgi:protein-S-isoprenylcysteine O-methyltransferase Ste14
LFWIGFHLLGLAVTVISFGRPTAKGQASKMPKIVQRIFAITFFLLPPLALSLLPQPRLDWPVAVGITTGLVLLIATAAIRRAAHRELGRHPALRQKSDLVTTGIYSRIRHPMYLSNWLLGAGLALTLRGVYALWCLPVWFFAYAVLIFFEERGLAEEYGQAYREYQERAPWRMIPRLF